MVTNEGFDGKGSTNEREAGYVVAGCALGVVVAVIGFLLVGWQWEQQTRPVMHVSQCILQSIFQQDMNR